MTDQGDTRQHFHASLAELEESLLDVAERAERAVEKAVRALVAGDVELAAQVVAEDHEIDGIYRHAHDEWIRLVALQAPMGSDLRLLAALLHLGVTFERMGDQAVNVARIVEITQGLPRAARMLERIQEMGDLVRPMIHTAIHSFARRDVDEARLLPAMDEPVDRLNRTMYREVLECGNDPELLEWATQMMLVARALERVGDQAVDVGEQLAFLVTGEYTEWSQLPAGDGGDR
ncbi:MAG: phosphate signaling complex protein PhoU [Acidimicrobiia bacterium]|jgi:phosphate transport system protein